MLRSLIGDKDFSLEHLYAVMLHYKQPVDGLEDLKDDQHLWDLFNGNPPSKTGKSARPKSKPRAGAKPRTKAAAKQSVKKTTAAKRASTTRVSNAGRKRAAKLTATAKGKGASRRAAPSAAKRSTKGTSAKKR